MALSTEQAPTGQLKRPHFHWVWKPAGQPNASWKWQLFGYYWRETPRRLNLVFSFRGLLLWSASLSFAAYLIGAAVIVGIWSRNPYNQVGYLDVVLPTRWTELRALRGKGLAAEGVAELRARRFATAIVFLQRGVALAPTEQYARLALADLHISAGYLHRAQRILRDGLEFGEIPQNYCERYLKLCVYLEDYDALLEGADILAAKGDKARQRDLNVYRALAFERLKRWDALDKLRKDHNEAPQVAIERAWARAQAAQGNARAGLVAIEAAPEMYGLPDERKELEVSLALEDRDFVRAARAAEAWVRDAPTKPLARVNRIIVSAKMSRGAQFRLYIDEYLAIWGADKPAMIQLYLGICSQLDNIWIREAKRQTVDFGELFPELRMLYIEALLRAGLIAEADGELSDAKIAMRRAKFAADTWLEGMQLIINACRAASESTRSQLLRYLVENRASPDAFHLAIDTLTKCEVREAVADLSIAARNRYPAFIGAAFEPKRESKSSSDPDSRASASVLIQESRPNHQHASMAPKTREVQQPKSAATLLKEADALAANKDFDAALALYSEIESGENDQLRREALMRKIRIFAANNNLDALTGSIRLLLRSSTSTEQHHLRKLAEEWRERHYFDSALILLREILARYPSANWARELQIAIHTDLKSDPPEQLSPHDAAKKRARIN